MLQGSLETRFMQSTSDYADVLQTGVIEKAKAAAVDTGLRQLIDDTTEGVLLIGYGNSVLGWLTGIPSSRKDYTGTKIRYALALQDEPGKMREWAGILCGLYSDQEQLKSLGTFLDGFIQDNRSVKPSLTFDEIADFLKNKSQPVQTDGIGAGCEFVLASYLAESEDSINSALSKVRMAPDKGVFWNGSGFSEVKRKKGSLKSLKTALTEKKNSSTALTEQKKSSATALTEQKNATTTIKSNTIPAKTIGWIGLLTLAAIVFLLLVAMSVKLNSDNDRLTKEKNNLSQTVQEQKGEITGLKAKVGKLEGEIQLKDKEITGLKTRVKDLEKSGKKTAPAPSTETGKTKPQHQTQRR